MNFSKFRIKPGTKAGLAKRDPTDKSAVPSAKGERLDNARRAGAAHRRPAGCALRRAQTQTPDRAARHGHQRQGRHDPARVQCGRSARRACGRFQSARWRGARTRFPLACAPAGAALGGDRDLQPQPLRGCADRARPQMDRHGGVQAPLRADQRLRAHADRQRHDDREVLPAHLEGRAEAPAAGTHRRSRQALEVQSRRPRGTQALGRLRGSL